jgi:hypothetical protein
MFTLGLTTMFGIVGLVSDFGYAYYRKEVAQAAAQAAAAATVRNAIAMSGGACDTNNVVCQSVTDCASSISGYGTTNVEKGCLYAIANGFTSMGKQRVTIESGSGSYNGVTVTYWAVARVSEKLPQLFSVVTGNTEATLTARAAVGYIPPTNGGCVYVIAPTGTALTTNGNTGLSSGCGVQVNSSSATAIDLSGGNTSITVTGTSNGVANGVNVVGNYGCYGQTTTCISPTPNTGSVSSGDPMSGIDAPTDNGCTDTAPSSISNGQTYTFHNSYTINVICGVVSAGNNKSVAFDSGNYIFRDGLNISNGNISGTGVFFYFESGASVQLTGNGDINLSAPTSGTYQGVLMFQARNNTTAAQIMGNSSMRVSGVLYFPNANVHFGGNGSSVNSSATTSIVAYNLTLDGNSTYIQGPATSPYMNTFAGYAVIE